MYVDEKPQSENCGIYKPWYTKIRSVFADDDRDCLYLLLKLYDVSRSISCNHTVFVRTYGGMEGVRMNLVFSMRNVWKVWGIGVIVLILITFIVMLPCLTKKIKDTLSEMEG